MFIILLLSLSSRRMTGVERQACRRVVCETGAKFRRDNSVERMAHAVNYMYTRLCVYHKYRRGRKTVLIYRVFRRNARTSFTSVSNCLYVYSYTRRGATYATRHWVWSTDRFRPISEPTRWNHTMDKSQRDAFNMSKNVTAIFLKTFIYLLSTVSLIHWYNGSCFIIFTNYTPRPSSWNIL